MVGLGATALLQSAVVVASGSVALLSVGERLLDGVDLVMEHSHG